MIKALFEQKESFIAYSRIIIELFIFYIYFRFKYKPSRVDILLDEKTKKKLIEEFKPEPLVDENHAFEFTKMVPFGSDPEMFELADYDFFNLRFSNKEEMIETIKEYGIGTCGPPGFYGTLDVHLKLEETIYKKLGMEAAILYSNSFTCTNSVITCFCKQYDVIFYHKNCDEAIIRALKITKGSSISFESLNELEEKIQKFYDGKKRNFIVTEALFRNTGEIIDFPRLIDIKNKYKLRLILDESLSIPLLGEKGISSYYNSDVNEIDILIGSLAYAYTGNGGFSAGSSFTVDYQRLSAQSYCFSASMPGFLATNAILNIKKDLDLQNLQFNTKLFHSTFNSKKYKIISNIDSPIICIARINKEKYSIIDEEARLRKIKKTLEDKKIRIGIIVNPFPSIRICIKNDLNESDCKKIVKTICHHIK